MLVKRFYTSVRFWQALVTQLVLPLFFVGYAMVLARTILFTDNASDPQRRLGLRETSLGLNRTLFWAEFGGAGGGNDGFLRDNTSTFFDFTDQVAGQRNCGCEARTSTCLSAPLWQICVIQVLIVFISPYSPWQGSWEPRTFMTILTEYWSWLPLRYREVETHTSAVATPTRCWTNTAPAELL